MCKCCNLDLKSSSFCLGRIYRYYPCLRCSKYHWSKRLVLNGDWYRDLKLFTCKLCNPTTDKVIARQNKIDLFKIQSNKTVDTKNLFS